MTMFKNVVLSVLLGCLFLITLAFSQEANTYRNEDMGFKIQKPATWMFEEKAPLELFIRPPLDERNILSIHFVLVVTSVPGMTAKQLPLLRERLFKVILGDAYRKVKEESVNIAGKPGQCLFFQSEKGKRSRWEEYYLVKDDVLYLLQFKAPQELFEDYRENFNLIFNSFKLIEPSGKEEVINELPQEELVLDSSSERVVFICNIDAVPGGEYLFMSAIPSATKLNNGRPIVIATDGKLSESARHFLKRNSPGKAYLLGSKHQGIQGDFIEQPSKLWDTADTVVVSAKERIMAVISAPLAARLNCPLLFDDDRLNDELRRLQPKHIIVVGKFHRDLPKFDAKITTLKNAVDVASLFGDFDYVALTNTYLDEHKPDRSYLLAPVLASYRNGVVYPICEKVKFNFGVLTERIEEEGKEYLQGKISLGQSEAKVKVPIRETIKELQQPHFDDPYLDIGDGKGFVLTKIGDTKVIDGIEYAFTMRMIGALGITKFHEHQRENRVYLLAPHSAGIQKDLLSFYNKTSMPKYVAVVGTPASIPFGYQRDPVYFNSTMHEQELATDNMYANIDEDDYIELSVGRIMTPDMYRGSVHIARIVTYDEMSGDWQKKALFIYPVPIKKVEKLPIPMVFSSFEALLKNMEHEMTHAGFEVTGQYGDEASLDAVYPYLQGQALIVFAQHSDALRWSFSVSDGTQYLVSRWGKKSKKLPPDISILPYFNASTLIIGLGCDSGGLDTGIEPEQAFLLGCFEKGAIGYIGNTRAGFPDTEEHVVKKMINDMIYQGVTVGEAFRNGKNYLFYLFRNRKPYQVSIFKDYSLAYEREFYQLVYYGDPAIKIKTPKVPAALTIQEKRKIENGSQVVYLTIQPSDEVWQYEVMNIKEIVMGPIEYLKRVSAPGLSYSSTEWGDYNATANPPRILPSFFVKYELPEDYSELNVSLEEGPQWCYQGYDIETLEDGKTYLLSNISMIQFLPRDGGYETAHKVTLKLTWQ